MRFGTLLSCELRVERVFGLGLFVDRGSIRLLFGCLCMRLAIGP